MRLFVVSGGQEPILAGFRGQWAAESRWGRTCLVHEVGERSALGLFPQSSWFPVITFVQQIDLVLVRIVDVGVVIRSRRHRS